MGDLLPFIPNDLSLQPVTTDRLVSAFLAGKSPRTIAEYRHDLLQFARFVKSPSIPHAAERLLSTGNGPANLLALDYRNALIAAELSPNTINRRLTALRSLVTLARTLGVITWHLDVKGLPRELYRDTRGPGTDGVRAMFRVLAGLPDRRSVRDRAILHLLWDLALRRAEVVSLDLEHLDLKAGSIMVLRKRRKERRRLTLPGPTRNAMVGWVDVRGEAPGPLFVNLSGGRAPGARLTARGLEKRIKEIGREAGLAHVTPHGIRHASITHALELSKGDVRAVQWFSGHQDVRTVMIYDDARRDIAGEIARLVAFEEGEAGAA